jgi:hypothetical protein
MNKCFTILSLLLTFSGSSFHAYSSSSLIEPEPLSRSSSALRYCLGGAILLASEVQSALAMQPTSTFDESLQEGNSTGQPCICPPASGTSAGDFYGNNVGVLATATFFSIMLAPKLNEWIITPTATYLWNRFCQTTIDDVPLGDRPEEVDLLTRISRKAYKRIMEPDDFYPVFQVKLRNYPSRELQAKIYKEIKLIDSILSNRADWVKEPITMKEKYWCFEFEKLDGFSYENSVLKLEIHRITKEECNTNLNLPAPVENNSRAQAWAEFADILHDKNSARKISALPDKVYDALKRLILNKEGNESTIIKNGDQFKIIYIKGICLTVTKYLHNLN